MTTKSHVQEAGDLLYSASFSSGSLERSMLTAAMAQAHATLEVAHQIGRVADLLERVEYEGSIVTFRQGEN